MNLEKPLKVLSILVVIIIALSQVYPSLSMQHFNSQAPHVKGRWILLLEEPQGYGLLDAQMMMEVSIGSQEPAVKLLESLGAEIVHRHWVVNAITFKADLGVVQKLRQLGYTIVEDMILKAQIIESKLEPPPDGVEPTADIKSIGADKLHNLGVTGRGVKVAVLDTGVENSHPWLIRGGSSVVKWEYDATREGIVDYCGKRINYHEGGFHGTHVAGIIASQNSRALGVALGADIYDIIVFGEELRCYSARTSDVVAGVEAALLGPDRRPNTGDEADILNLSLGMLVPPWIAVYLTELPIIKTLSRAVSMGKLVVIAAGNYGGFHTVNTLCLADGVICVGASNTYWWLGDYAGDDEVAWFSSRGPIPWGRVAPDFVAPGVNIYSTIPTALAFEWRLAEPAYYASGTSMAAPHVSGALALLIEHYRNRGVAVSPDFLKKLLSQSARPIGFRSWTPTPMDQGSGQINVYDAITSTILVEIERRASASAIAYGDIVSFRVRVANVGVMSVRVSLDASLLEVYTEESVPRDFIKFSETVIEIPPGDSRNVTLNVKTVNLKPGTYAGYVLAYDGKRYYRAPFSILVPARLSEYGGVLRAELSTVVGKASGLNIAFLDWSAAGIYVESPVADPVMISVWAQSSFFLVHTPFHARILSPKGALAPLPSSGLMFSSPGLYIIVFELDLINLFLGYTAPIPVRVVMEAPRISDLVVAREAILRAVGEVESLKVRVSALEGRIATLESRILAVENRVSTLEGRFESLKFDVERLKADVNNMLTRVSDIESRISRAELNLKALEAEIKDLQSKVNSIIRNTTELYGRLATLEGALEAVREDLKAASREISNLKTEVGSARKEIEVLSRDISNLKADVDLKLRNLEARFNGSLIKTREYIERVRADLSSSLQALGEKLASVEGSLTARIEESSKMLTLRLEATEGSLKSVGEKTVTLELGLESVKKDLKTLDSSLATLSAVLEKARKELEDRISMESERLDSKAFRAEILGAAGLTAGLAATALAAYTLVRRK